MHIVRFSIEDRHHARLKSSTTTSTTDSPCSPKSANRVFGPGLVEAYPDSKVVLVERDVDAWYKSFNESVLDVPHNPVWRFLATIGARYVAEVNT
ncbi:hypothetical protein BKA56DRAFT_671149 [Ilyonectria sp. MPI-CAGE-AT-0026]|nr:hypothetical protein BKA56DRAFT_671149 [Ilyonectria sp. MPI-CAGE-AT-0026]